MHASDPTNPSNSPSTPSNRAARNLPWFIAIGACVPFSMGIVELLPLELRWQRALVAGLIAGLVAGMIGYIRQRSLRALRDAA
jgi:hypothetical protein